MQTATLANPKGSAPITKAELINIAPPQATHTWRPIGHYTLVDTLDNCLAERGLTVTEQQMIISSDRAKLFGTFTLTNQITDSAGSALGFRHSNDKTIAIQIIAGAKVFVCDNMVFSGDINVLRTKHTWRYELHELIHQGLDRWTLQQDNMAMAIGRLQQQSLTDDNARALLARALYTGITTHKVFADAYELYFEKAIVAPAEFPDVAPRSAWGLHNAYTRALKNSKATPAFDTTLALGKFFNI